MKYRGFDFFYTKNELKLSKKDGILVAMVIDAWGPVKNELRNCSYNFEVEPKDVDLFILFGEQSVKAEIRRLKPRFYDFIIRLFFKILAFPGIHQAEKCFKSMDQNVLNQWSTESWTNE